MWRHALVFITVLLVPSGGEAQERERKRAQALRVADGAIRVDGRLDEAAWRTAVPITDFVQKEPDEGAPSRRRSAAATKAARPSTCRSRSTPISIAAPRRPSALRRARAGAGDLFRSFGAAGDHVFAVKASVWLSR